MTLEGKILDQMLFVRRKANGKMGLPDDAEEFVENEINQMTNFEFLSLISSTLDEVLARYAEIEL